VANCNLLRGSYVSHLLPSHLTCFFLQTSWPPRTEREAPLALAVCRRALNYCKTDRSRSPPSNNNGGDGARGRGLVSPAAGEGHDRRVLGRVPRVRGGAPEGGEPGRPLRQLPLRLDRHPLHMYLSGHLFLQSFQSQSQSWLAFDHRSI
jgi:hypothetical protein